MKLTFNTGATVIAITKELITREDVLKVYEIAIPGITEAPHLSLDELLTVTARQSIPQVDKAVAPKAILAVKEEVAPRPRAIELLNSDRALSTSIESSAHIKRENVKVYVFCPHCKHEGDQFTFRGNRFLKCHGCQEKLFLQPAGEDWGETDADGYEYHAIKEYYWRGESE